MKTKQTATTKTTAKTLLGAAAALLAAPAALHAQGFQDSRDSTDLTGLNFNNGFYNDLSGLLNTANGNVISVTGQNMMANGGYHALDGANMTTASSSFFNVTHGFNNQAMGSAQWIGGQNNIATGVGSYIYATNATDNGFPGTMTVTDYDPAGNRAGAGGTVGAGAPHAYTSIFHGGHSFFVDDQNFLNGMFVVPSDASAATGNVGQDGPAFVGINTGLGPVQGGTAGRGPINEFHVNGDGTSNATRQGHIALIRDISGDSSCLALQTSRTGNVADTNNFLTFFNGNGSAIGGIEGNNAGGVQLDTSSSDFAEYLPKADLAMSVAPTDIVGVRNGEIVAKGQPADHYMAISGQAAVAGNSPGDDRSLREQHGLTAFIGQIPVKVAGTVDTGDFILASDANDGVGIAKPATAIAPGELHRVVGRAWESSDETAVKPVNTAVGLDHTALIAPLLERLAGEVDRLSMEVADLRERVAEKDAMLAALR